MKKKIGFNIMLFVFIIYLILNISCSEQSPKSEEGILMKTDREFSAMSVKEGMFKAFLAYVADDGVVLRDNSFPDIGKESMEKRFSGKYDTAFILSWEPLFEKISKSGDLGYTYGLHTNTDKKTGEIKRGTYVTIWQKRSDGSWKYVLDAGTQGLPE
jgi:ketosteroid isomerase-like protein